jgi:hypothetical protein
MDLFRRLTGIPGVHALWRRWPVGTVSRLVEYDVWDRPAYAYGVLRAAELARSLRVPAISVAEFGVAGGRGLLALERIARRISRDTGVVIQVLGFDAGDGMPEPLDYRDLPHVWQRGFYRMDQAALRAKLNSARLIIGDVGDTAAALVREPTLAPLGFVSFDLDYYSSTKKALRIFDGPPHTRLPRVWCYFDDLIEPERACHNEWVGERLAIDEFNREHERRKLGAVPSLRATRPRPSAWNEQMFVFHDFDHPEYTTLITPEGDSYRQIPLGS